MENGTGSAAPAALAQENNKEAPAPCFKRATVGEDVTFVEAAKEHLKQFTEAPMEEHWSCIKNKLCSMLGDAPTIFGGNKATPSLESSQQTVE